MTILSENDTPLLLRLISCELRVNDAEPLAATPA
jgi:hypothetical protein